MTSNRERDGDILCELVCIEVVVCFGKEQQREKFRLLEKLDQEKNVSIALCDDFLSALSTLLVA